MVLDTTSYLLGKKAGGGGTDTSDANATASDIAQGKSGYVKGVKINGDVPVGSSAVATNYSANNVDTYLDDLKVDTTQGNRNQFFYTGDKISVYAPLTDVAPVIGASAEKIKKDEVICGVTGTYEGSGGKYAPRKISFQSYNGTELDYEVGNLDTSYINNMNNMFYYCMQLTRLDLSTWDASNVTTFYSFCERCNRLSNITFGNNFNTSNADTFTNMFVDCYALTSLNLSSFNTKKVTSVLQMFRGCKNLTHIDFGDNFEFPLLQTNHQNMFLNCTKLDDDTLNSILHICTTMNVGTKRLDYIGIQDSTLVAKIPTLSNYQEFLDAGWTIS